MSHTPGPWTYAEYDKYDEFSIDAAKRQVARSNGYNLDPDEHAANARLIAAAPEMYEALKEVVRRLETVGRWAENVRCSDVPDECSIGQARAAIAKAEGRP